ITCLTWSGARDGAYARPRISAARLPRTWGWLPAEMIVPRDLLTPPAGIGLTPSRVAAPAAAGAAMHAVSAKANASARSRTESSIVHTIGRPPAELATEGSGCPT